MPATKAAVSVVFTLVVMWLFTAVIWLTLLNPYGPRLAEGFQNESMQGLINAALAVMVAGCGCAGDC